MNIKIKNEFASVQKVAVICLFCLYAGVLIAQETGKTTWDFPVRYGTKEWETLKTVEEQFNAYNIPDNIIKEISTEELVKICLSYPEWGLMFAYNDKRTGVYVLIGLFNGFRELLNRNDAVMELLKVYEKLDPLSVDPNWTALQKGRYGFQFTKIEMFLCFPIVSKLDKKDIQKLKEAVVVKYQKKRMLPAMYSLWDLSPTVGICLNIIETENAELIRSRTDLKMFKHTLRSNDIHFLDSIVELLKKVE